MGPPKFEFFFLKSGNLRMGDASPGMNIEFKGLLGCYLYCLGELYARWDSPVGFTSGGGCKGVSLTYLVPLLPKLNVLFSLVCSDECCSKRDLEASGEFFWVADAFYMLPRGVLESQFI